MGEPATGRTARIWRDGQLVNWEDATIHVISHVVHYGSSVFEGMRCYETPSGGAVFRARDHMRRLVDSCRIYRIPLKYSVDELVRGCLDTIAANQVRECYFRPVVIRTGEQMDVLAAAATVETYMIAWKWGAYLGTEGMQHGVDARVSSWRRAAPDTFPTMAKAGGNYLSSQLAKMEAKADGYAEGIMLDAAGFISEGSGENLFAVRDNVLYTAPLSAGILPGITRDTIIQLAHDLGLEVREQLLPREFLYIADELFFCGTAVEVTPVRSVDRVPVGSGDRGPVTARLQKLYLDTAHGRAPDPHGWLTPVPEPAVVAAGAGR
ncbi:MAG TPA: branched-chain amino acid transaminase [Gemmatimonadaceae bacterium]|nr:branched-chain amino acid transaminase [Gemmatimonadaceae bacterium]